MKKQPISFAPKSIAAVDVEMMRDKHNPSALYGLTVIKVIDDMKKPAHESFHRFNHYFIRSIFFICENCWSGPETVTASIR